MMSQIFNLSFTFELNIFKISQVCQNTLRFLAFFDFENIDKCNHRKH